jgi:hypothetical protein
MAEKKLLKATHHGIVKLAGTNLECDVLEDGTRVISRNAIFRAFKRTKRGRAKNETRVPNMPSFIDAKNLQPFISSHLMGELKTIDYVSVRGKGTSGFKAEIIPLLCDVYLRAREEEALTKPQERIAQVAEILVRSLSKIGIVGLVDEATGYQYVRDKGELHRILEMYVRQEFLPWTKRFPDTFYEELFRLKGWSYNPLSVKRPQIVGRLTNELVYDKLPKGVLAELKRVTPKSNAGNYTKRFHQSLTDDIGNPHLEKHLASVITLMKVSPDWRRFMRLFVRGFGGQLELDFEKED